ncbi:retropepsin-like domain-containing protein [Spirosoma sp. BT702]|uniref:Retropepsin-like domain-containing protein n=1 Tax=Spirosoma profusum TaxID=2771354 RepID=A0A927ASI6_9BACT|nr:retropepsin-like aspartic protease [Spirosoma profusum]MBD2703916.1 retropepsin-like domain-containing protein [Spirosoma profusum]
MKRYKGTRRYFCPNSAPVFILLRFAFLLLIGCTANGQAIRQPTFLTVRDNLMYIPVKVNGRGPYNFLLNSGVTGMARIDRRLAKELGLNIVGFQQNTTGNQVKREFLVGVNQLSAGNSSHSALQLAVDEYNPVVKPQLTDGLIGQNFFDGYLITIDGPNHQWLVTKDTLSRQAKGVLTYSKSFVITGTVGSKVMPFNLDVSSNQALLFPKSSLVGVHYTDTANQQVITQGNTNFVLQEAIIQDEIVLGGLRLINQKIYYSDKVHQISIGTAFLKDHVVRFDQRKKLIRID